MALSSTEICNFALSLFGSYRISDIDEATETANLCKLWYEQVRDEVLCEAGVDWKFAIARTELTQVATDPDFGWDYQYQLPDNLLKILAVVHDEYDLPDAEWLREGSYILTNQEDCHIRYIQSVADVTKYPLLLVKAIYTLLASVLAGRIAQNAQKSLELLQEYEAVLSKAKMTNAEETYIPDEKGKPYWHQGIDTRNGRTYFRNS